MGDHRLHAVGFVDHEAIDRCVPPPHTPPWLDLLDTPDHLREDSADIRLPLATLNQWMTA